MKKLINAIILAVVLFIILNFVYSNMTPDLLGYQMSFRFELPGVLTLRSVDMPLGFVLILTFSIGIIFLAFLQAIPSMFRSKDHREQQRKIRDLENEVAHFQEKGGDRPKPGASSPTVSAGL